jgi:hypothetical protein
MKIKWIVMISLVSLLFLAGCEQKIELKFPKEQNWTVKSTADFDRDVVKGAGEIAGSVVGSELGFSLPGSLFDPKVILPPMMRLYQQAFEQQGMDFKWSYVADKLKFEIGGTSYSQLTKGASPDYLSIVPVGGGNYRLTINYASLGEEYNTVQGMVYETELSVTAGKIISSNADKVTGSKAIWYNPTSVEVTFKPGTSANVGMILVALVGIAAVFGIGKALSGGGRITCPSCGAKVGKGTEECPSCGSWL